MADTHPNLERRLGDFDTRVDKLEPVLKKHGDNRYRARRKISVDVLCSVVLLAPFLLPPFHLRAQSIPSGYVNTTATVPALANGQFASAWTNLSSSPQLGLLGCVSSFQTTVNGRFNASGHFAVLLADTAQICPSPSTWTFTFTFSCSAGSIPSAFVVQVPVTGGGISEDISSQITSALPATQCSSGGGGGGGSGSPAPPGYAVQLANSSATGFAADPNIFINPFTHTLTAEILNGVRNAASFALSPGGIAACASGATGQTCVADPTYALSEQYSLTSMIPSVPGQFAFEDLRNGIATNFHHDWAFTTNNFGSSAAIFDACLTDGISAPAVTNNNWTRDCHDLVGTDTTRGWDQGQQAVGVQGWYSTHGMTVTANVNGMGITEGFGTSQTKYGVGDNAGLLASVTGFGGFVAGADEGTKPLAVYNNEGIFVPTVTCSTGCTTGTTSFKGTAVVNAVTSWGVGRYVIDTTQTPTSTTISSFTASALNCGAGDTCSTVTVPATVAVSNAWGTLSGACSPGVRNNTPPFTTSTACSVTVVSGTFDTTHLVCFKGGQHECTIPTTVTNGSGPTATVTMNMTGTGHENGSTIMQGGMAGYGMDATFYDQTINGQTFRYLYDVIGSASANTLEVQGWYTTGARALQFSGYPGWSGGTPGSANLSTLTNSGTTVSAVYVSAGSTLTLTQFNKGTVLIAGASDTAFNAACTNVIFTTSTAFTCTIAGLSGSHTATTATAGLATAAGVTVGAINLYPMAEVLDVQNEALAPPSIDGTMTLEPNVMAIAPGDTLEETHHQSAKFTIMTGLNNVYNPYSSFGGIGLTANGAGVQGGSGSVTAAALVSIGHSNADTLYKGGGGYLIPPNMQSWTGAYNIGITTNEGPVGGQPFINIATTAAQRNDPNYTYPLFISANLSSATSWTLTPNTGHTSFSTNGVATWTASSHTFNGPVNLPSGSTLPATGVGVGSCTFCFLTYQADGRTTVASSAGPSSALSIGSLSAGGVAVGSLSNLVGDSTNIAGSTWLAQTGTTVTPSQTDPYGGTTASQLANTIATQGMLNTGGVTLTSGSPYTVCAWLKGAIGGEFVWLAVGNVHTAAGIQITSSWAQYGPFVLTPTGTLGTTFDEFPNSTSQTTFLAFPSTVAGSLTTCPAYLPTIGTSAGAVVQTVSTPGVTIPNCGGKYTLADGTGCGTPSGTLPNATDTFNTIQVNSSGTGSVVTAAVTGTWEAHQQGNADNTGSVDASTILNAETTTVCASTTPPRIHLAAGTYTINSSWTIAATSTTCKNLVIEGDGSGNTILQGNCSSHPYVVGWINSTSPAAEAFAGPTFRHLTIKNTDAHSPNHCAIGLLISQAALFKVNDLVITGFAGQTYATGTISSSGSTVTGSGTTFTAAMVHGFIETTSGNTTARAEICAFGSTTSLTLCDSAFPTGDLSASTVYALPYGGAGLVCDPGAGISGSPFTQYSTISDVYAPGNLIGIDAWGTTAGGCSRVQVTGNAGYISASPGSRVTDAVGIWLGHNSDTWEISAPINNVAVGIVNDSGHAQRISAKVENGGTLTPVTTCNGGVASQACTAAFEWSSDTNGHGWNTYFDSAYAYVIGNVYQFDNAGGAFNASITAPRDLSGQYTQHYSFSGTTGCPAIGSGVLTQIRAYDCSYDPNYVAHGYLSFATGEITTITANGQFNPAKITSTVTAVNITATADAFTCSVNPVITLEDCGTIAGVCGSPSALGSVTLTAANTITDGTVSTPTLTAGHYIAWETTAGTCTDLNVSGSAAY